MLSPGFVLDRIWVGAKKQVYESPVKESGKMKKAVYKRAVLWYTHKSENADMVHR